MIVAQPHSGVNPVTIYERRGPGEYTAKISVTIISLLHDFTQLHPNLIELYDIGNSLTRKFSLTKKTFVLVIFPVLLRTKSMSSITILQTGRTENYLVENMSNSNDGRRKTANVSLCRIIYHYH